MKLNPPNAHRLQIKICEKRQTRNVQFRFMPNAFRILKPIQKSSKCVWVFRNTGANAFPKNQTRLAYEDKRDLYCMSGRWHRHLMWSCELQENTLPCVWWGNPLTPYKHCHTGSAHPGRTEVIDLLSSTRQQTQAVTHPSTKWEQYCLTSWVIIYYMSHTIDKWNLYWSYTIKCIFAGIQISRFDPR